MKNKIICLLLPLFLLGCSKRIPTEFNGMAEKQIITPSPALPFQVTIVWPDVESRQMIDAKKSTALLFKTNDFENLDDLAGKLRLSKRCYANGLWNLWDFYAGLTPSQDASDEEYSNCISTLQKWIKAKPDSITARVALARVLADFAWKARGSGYANTVTDKGWQLFGERLNESMKVLDAAKELKAKCPVYWTTKMRLALGLQFNKSQLNVIFDEAINYAPDYETFYMRRANYLMPRWNGGAGELEDDLEKQADKMGGGENGDMLYARVVWDIHDSGSSENIMRENGFSWARVDRGFKVIEKKFPDSLAAISEHAYLAAYAGDDEAARACLKKTGGKADLAIFYYKEEYIRVANWAFGK